MLTDSSLSVKNCNLNLGILSKVFLERSIDLIVDNQTIIGSETWERNKSVSRFLIAQENTIKRVLKGKESKLTNNKLVTRP